MEQEKKFFDSSVRIARMCYVLTVTRIYTRHYTTALAVYQLASGKDINFF
jgi:hypothetical protein